MGEQNQLMLSEWEMEEDLIRSPNGRGVCNLPREGLSWTSTYHCPDVTITQICISMSVTAQLVHTTMETPTLIHASTRAKPSFHTHTFLSSHTMLVLMYTPIIPP